MQVQAGQTGVFQAVVVPSNGALQAGAIPQWSVDDPSAVLAPSADGFTCSVSIPATDSSASFNLTVTGINSAGVSIADTVNVPIVAAPPVPPPPATGFVINQLS